MNKDLRMKIYKAKRDEEIIKDALEYNYFDKKARKRNFEALKKVQIHILKLYLEDKKDENTSNRPR